MYAISGYLQRVESCGMGKFSSLNTTHTNFEEYKENGDSLDGCNIYF